MRALVTVAEITTTVRGIAHHVRRIRERADDEASLRSSRLRPGPLRVVRPTSEGGTTRDGIAWQCRCAGRAPADVYACFA